MCLPFEVHENETLGRFLIASRDIEPLEIVLRDIPAVLAPQSRPVCLICLRSVTNQILLLKLF